MSRIKLNVKGVSYNDPKIQQVYVLVLAEEDGPRYLPVVIGAGEAQAIYTQMERIRMPRPLTHDLLVQFASAFNIQLVEVNINLLKGHIFQAEMLCTNKEKQVSLDARASDAVALALRFQCPIFTTEDVMQEVGMTVDDVKSTNELLKHPSQLSTEDLRIKLSEAVAAEDYEAASQLRDELRSRETN